MRCLFTPVLVALILGGFANYGLASTCDDAQILSELDCTSDAQAILGSTLDPDVSGYLTHPDLTCFDPAQDGVAWYSFVATGADIELSDVSGGNPSFALFKFDGCSSPAEYITCGQLPYSWALGDPDNLLEPGESYLLIIAYAGVSAPGATFELCVNNPPVPVNDRCEWATRLTSLELLGCDQGGTSVVGSTKYATNAGLNSINYYPFADPICMLDTAEDDGVWYIFEAEGTSLSIEDLRGTNPTVMIMSYNECTDTATVVLCKQLPVSGVHHGNKGFISVVQGESYLMYVTHQGGGSQGADFELCIRNFGRCGISTDMPQNWCEPNLDNGYFLCELYDLDGYCFMNPPDSSFSDITPWTGCPSYVVNNPNWVVFMAGAEQIELEVSVGGCSKGRGIQMALYELDYNDVITIDSCLFQDIDSVQLVSGCDFLYIAPSHGSSVVFQNPTEPGKIYGLMFDGWRGDVCNVFVDVPYGGSPYQGTGIQDVVDTTGVSIFTTDTFYVGRSYQIEALTDEGLEDKPFEWTIDHERVAGSDLDRVENVSFTCPGSHLICVSVSTPCFQSNPLCGEVIVIEPDTNKAYIDKDISCGEVFGVNSGVFTSYAPGEVFTVYPPAGQPFKTDTFTIQTAGEYLLTIGDPCDDWINIKATTSYFIDFDVDVFDCRFADLTVNVDGLEAPSYLWSTGDTTASLDSLSFGGYSVIITAEDIPCDIEASQFIEYPGECLSTVCGQLILSDSDSCAGMADTYGHSDQLLEVLPVGLLVASDSGGLYSLQLPPGDYTLVPVLSEGNFAACPDSISIHIDEEPDTFKHDVVILDTTRCEVYLQATVGRARPGSEVRYSIRLFNKGRYVEDFTIKAVLDSEYLLSSLRPIGVAPPLISNDTITWELQDMAPGGRRTIRFNVKLNSSAQVGDVLGGSVMVLGECINSASLTHEVVNSYDPNDKTLISTVGRSDAHILRSDSVLHYRIRFENTGTDTAYRVQIVDDLSSKLDLRSIKSGASSHPYTWRIVPPRTLEILFDPIRLPPSVQDRFGAQGFVSFYIQTDEALEVGDTLDNKVAIYFDANDPIITNTARTIYKRPQVIVPAEFEVCIGDTFMSTVIYEDQTVDVTYPLFDMDSIVRYELTALGWLTEIYSEVEYGAVVDGVTVTGDTTFERYYEVLGHPCDSVVRYEVRLVSSTDNPSTADWLIYPNPFDDHLYIEYAGEITAVSILDAKGSQILSVRGGQTRPMLIDTQLIPAGLYFISVQTASGSWVYKGVKL